MKRRLHAYGRGISLKWRTLATLLCCFSILLFSLQTRAQNSTINGTVADDKGVPLAGVTVKVKGTTTGATTDGNGKFQIAVANRNATLQFGYVGFITQEVPLNGRSNLTVTPVSYTHLKSGEKGFST